MKTIFQKNFNNLISSNSTKKNSAPGPRHLPIETLAINQIQQTISYSGIDYSSPIPSTFLLRINNLRQIENYSFLFCRDGLFSLLDFFHKHPNPNGIKTILLINSVLASFVPTSWLSNILFYEFGLHNQLNYRSISQEKNSLLIKGFLLSSDCQSLERYAATISLIKKSSLKKFEQVKIYFCCREDYFLNSSWERDNDHTKRLIYFYPQLFRLLEEHPNVDFLTYNDLLSIKNYHLFHYLDLNAKAHYISDDYIDFSLLSRGVIPLEKLNNKAILHNQFIPLSPYHGYSILTPNEIIQASVSSEVKKIDTLKKQLKLSTSDTLSFDFFSYIYRTYQFKRGISIKKFKIT